MISFVIRVGYEGAIIEEKKSHRLLTQVVYFFSEMSPLIKIKIQLLK